MLHSLRPLFIVALAAAVLGTSSCATLRRFLPHDESQKQAQRLQEMQLKVMRFADQYSGRIAEPIERFNVSGVTPEDRLRAQDWRLGQATSAYTIASGPSPVVNALDMIVLATLSRMVIEDFWMNELYGTRASTLLEVHRGLEQEAWQLVDGVLSSEQHTQLRGMIDTWRSAHPKVRAVAQMHFVDFAKTVGRSGQEPGRSGSLFAFLGLDPLSNLDPAVREIEQTRLLAERAIYYVQRAPNLLDMQVERLSYQIAVTPEVKQALSDVDRISLAAAAAGEFTNDLPATFARERHATIVDLTRALDSQQAQLRKLMSEVRGLVPELRKVLDASSDSVEHIAASTSQDLHQLLDHAFWRGVHLVLILVAAVLAAALAYRFITMGARWAAWKSITSRERSGVE